MEDKLEDKNTKKSEEKNGIGESGVQHRLSATKEADEALNRIVERVNDGFSGGRVSRMQALSWLLIQQAEGLSESVIQEIRAEFFDEVALLESILRQAKSTGKVPHELRGVLQKQLGLNDESSKKKAKKVLTET